MTRLEENLELLRDETLPRVNRSLDRLDAFQETAQTALEEARESQRELSRWIPLILAGVVALLFTGAKTLRRWAQRRRSDRSSAQG